jgi:hypothetical protein
MMGLKSTRRRGTLGLAALVVWLVLHGAASAQIMAGKDGQAGAGQARPASGSSSQSGSYVFPYVFVGLGIAGGLYVVCRSSFRRDRARPEEYVALLDGPAGK